MCSMVGSLFPIYSPWDTKNRPLCPYTEDQSHARMLAIIFGAGKYSPEVHGNGQYGHYHDSTHSFHIWFGAPIIY